MEELTKAFVVSSLVYGVGAIVMYFTSRRLSPWGKQSRREAFLDVAPWWVVMVVLSTITYAFII